MQEFQSSANTWQDIHAEQANLGSWNMLFPNEWNHSIVVILKWYLSFNIEVIFMQLLLS